MTNTIPILPFAVAIGVVCTFIGFIVGYIIGRRSSRNPIKFALQFTFLQLFSGGLFVAYNLWISETPDTFVNLALIALIGGETVGALFTQGVEKALNKTLEGDNARSKKS